MRLLPCSTPTCAPSGALWPASPKYPRGEPAVTGQYVPSYTCRRCGRLQRLGQVDYNRLPELTLEKFKELGMGDLPVRDWMGIGLSARQAEDMFKAGLGDPNDVTRRPDGS